MQELPWSDWISFPRVKIKTKDQLLKMFLIICLPGPDDVPQLDPGGDSLRGRVWADQAAGAGEVTASQERGDLHPADWARQLQVRLQGGS